MSLKKDIPNFITSTRVSHGSTGGRVFAISVTSFFVDGKKVGIGRSTASSFKDALGKSFNYAKNHTESFDFLERQNLTLPVFLRFRFRSNYFEFAPSRKPGSRAHSIIVKILNACGFKNFSVKIHGSRHPYSIAYGVLEYLKRVELILKNSKFRKSYLL